MAEALNNLLQQAIAMHQQGKLDAAKALYEQVLQRDAANFDARHLSGVIALQRGELEPAVRLISDAIAINPNQSAAYSNLGNALQQLGRFEEAVGHYDHALSLNPAYADALNNRGMALRKLGRTDAALADFQRALELNPDYPDALFNQSNLLRDLQRSEEAITSYAHLIRLKPKHIDALYNLGCLFGNRNQHDIALKYFDQVLALNPKHLSALSHQGGARWQLKFYEAAIESFKRLLEIAPGYEYALGYLFNSELQCCDWSDYDEHLEKIMAGISEGKRVESPFPSLAILQDAEHQLQCAKIYAAHKYPIASSALYQGKRYAHKKIRVAYVSADFRHHPVSHLMVGLFEKHDRSRFEIIAISLRPALHSAMGLRVEAAFDQFIDVTNKTDEETANIIKVLEVDIAVDLMGFTGFCRPGIFARRPAPIQINYLGFPSSMGVSYIDYMIADRYVVQPQSEPHFSEKLIYMPDCFQVNDDQRVIPENTPGKVESGLPESGLVLCTFNNPNKLNPAFFAIWMRLLQQAPDSVLWLAGSRSSVINNLRNAAVMHGITPDRLVFAPQVDYQEHLARLRHADLFLDSLPFNGGTTTSDALWAGIPTISCSGDAFSSRMSGSLLHAIGLPELVTDNLEDYEKLALELVTQPEKLQGIKHKLQQNRLAYPLFDTDRFRRHLESAYEVILQRHALGLTPAHIDIASDDHGQAG